MKINMVFPLTMLKKWMKFDAHQHLCIGFRLILLISWSGHTDNKYIYTYHTHTKYIHTYAQQQWYIVFATSCVKGQLKILINVLTYCSAVADSIRSLICIFLHGVWFGLNVKSSFVGTRVVVRLHFTSYPADDKKPKYK